MKKTKILLIVFLVCFIIGAIGFSGCFLMFKIKSYEEIQMNNKADTPVLESGLVFNFIDESIHLDKAIPTLDKFGVEEKGITFSIKNNNLDSILYELKLVDDDSTIRNSDIRYELTKNDKVVGIFSLSDDGIIEKETIKSKEEIKYTIKLWLDINSEVKVGRLSKKIAINEIDEENISNINKPILVDGMIPVIYDQNSNSWNKADTSKWYSYEESSWANAVTVNSSKRKVYQESPVGTKIEMDDINSMWVWIPRFNYSLREADVSIKFTKINEPAYLAFSFNDHELEGFWFSKFESGMKSDSGCITSSLTNVCNNSNNKLYFVPNYPFSTKISMANMFYAIRKMELKGNIYGFNGTGSKLNLDGTINNDKNDLDIHMIRNSEWQAVALLSNSIYGNKTLQVLNNNSNLTGKVFYEDEEYDYNVLSKGEKASSNGNITGIYDMSGGKREYVMIENSELSIFDKKSNSGFNFKIKDYYYDDKFNEKDTTLLLKSKYSVENKVDSEPITRGGYKNTGNIFNLYSASDYIKKVSVETNSRACLIVMKEMDYEEKKES